MKVHSINLNKNAAVKSLKTAFCDLLILALKKIFYKPLVSLLFIYLFYTTKRKKNQEMTTQIRLTPLQQRNANLGNSIKRAAFIYARMIKNGAERCLKTWHNAIRESWKATKALIKGVVTFAKIKTAEITTRRIAALSFNAPTDDIIRVTDLDKGSIISFHSFQILNA